MRKNGRIQASMTVEAALAFPVFFFAVITLCGLFTFWEVRLTVRRAMVETARGISAYGDILVRADGEPPEVLGYLTDALAVRALLEGALEDKELISNYVEGGEAGIACVDSVLMTDEESVRIVCRYSFRLPISFFDLGKISVRQELDYRYFTGHKVATVLESADREDEPQEQDDKTVYVTEQGKVYHLTLKCPALNLHISEIAASQISSARNENGGRYKACEKCAKGARPDVLFITTDGDRYHYVLNCSGLKRTIREVKLSELKEMNACKRCGKTE